MSNDEKASELYTIYFVVNEIIPHIIQTMNLMIIKISKNVKMTAKYDIKIRK